MSCNSGGRPPRSSTSHKELLFCEIGEIGMPSERVANRWMIAVAAAVMQICLGAVYGWSVFVKPLTAEYHWTLTQVPLNFTIAIAVLGVGTIVAGLWQDRIGPRLVSTLAGVIYGIGYIVARRTRWVARWNVLRVRRARRIRHRHGIHHAGGDAGEMVPGSARSNDRSCCRRLRCGALIFSPIAARLIQTMAYRQHSGFLVSCTWCSWSRRRSSIKIRRRDGGPLVGCLAVLSQRRLPRSTSQCRRQCVRGSSGCYGSCFS